MTDVQTTPEQDTQPPKTPKQPHSCLCSSYEVVGASGEAFTTGCEATTFSTFAQGHDARLVSFLVDGHFDGYAIQQVTAEGTVTHANPEAAAKVASAALGEKARKATETRQAKAEAKKEREQEREAKRAERAAAKEKAKAEKAAEPKATGAEVAAGSREGDAVQLAEGQARIKVGRFEYVATLDDDGNATYTDGKGEVKVVNRDGYRLLEQANA